MLTWPLGAPGDPGMGPLGPRPLPRPPPHAAGGRAQLCSLLEFTHAPASRTVATGALQQDYAGSGARATATDARSRSRGMLNEEEEMCLYHKEEEEEERHVAARDREGASRSGGGTVRELRRVLVQGDAAVGAHHVRSCHILACMYARRCVVLQGTKYY